MSVLASASGNLKKPIKPDQLYEAHLSYTGKVRKKKTRREEIEEKRDIKSEIERLAALAPPPQR